MNERRLFGVTFTLAEFAALLVHQGPEGTEDSRWFRITKLPSGSVPLYIVPDVARATVVVVFSHPTAAVVLPGAAFVEDRAQIEWRQDTPAGVERLSIDREPIGTIPAMRGPRRAERAETEVRGLGGYQGAPRPANATPPPGPAASVPVAPAAELRRPFDPEREAVFCARCGRRCERGGHMTGVFLMCPAHGEFTIGPLVVMDSRKRAERFARAFSGEDPGPEPEGGHYDDERWEIVFRSEQERAMWDNCRAIDELRP